MKRLAILTLTFATLGLATAQAQPVQYTQEQLDQMPRYNSIEQERCPKARYPSVKKHMECKQEVRIELFEKQQADQGSAIKDEVPSPANNYGGHGHAH